MKFCSLCLAILLLAPALACAQTSNFDLVRLRDGRELSGHIIQNTSSGYVLIPAEDPVQIHRIPREATAFVLYADQAQAAKLLGLDSAARNLAKAPSPPISASWPPNPSARPSSMPLAPPRKASGFPPTTSATAAVPPLRIFMPRSAKKPPPVSRSSSSPKTAPRPRPPCAAPMPISPMNWLRTASKPSSGAAPTRPSTKNSS